MKKYIIGIIILLLILITILLVILLNKDNIVGKWKLINSDYELYYIFNDDKTCSYEMIGAKLDCTYEENGEELIILYKGDTVERKFNYYLKDDKLIIVDTVGKANIFSKEQKKD